MPAALAYLRSLVETLSSARFRRVRGSSQTAVTRKDEEDWPTSDAALSLACGVWTEDMDFFGAGVAVWTMDRVELFLSTNAEPLTTEDQ